MNLRQFFVGRTIVFLIILVVLGLVAAFYALNKYIYEEKQAYAASEYKDAEFIIQGERIRLTDGVAETAAAPGSASKIITRYFGNELKTDLNGDGREDIVFLLTQETGGSGIFYYVVAALNTDRGYVGSEALLLGDRIAPQTIEKGTGKIVVVTYADRAPGEPFSISPSVGKSISLLLDLNAMQFGEVAQNFEGEADPSRMTLGMKTWVWVSALYNDGREARPKNAGVFTLTFSADGRFSAKTDCDGIGGNYVANSNTVSFSQMMSTQMYCEGSQESDFASLLQNTQGYHFTSRGELVFDLKFDSGSVVFR
ncbi:MAG: META domain-containing protein [Minisyncoccia bacterium]